MTEYKLMLVPGKGNPQNNVVRFPGSLKPASDSWAPSDISCKRGCTGHYTEAVPFCISLARSLLNSRDFSKASAEFVKAAHCPRAGYPERTGDIIGAGILRISEATGDLKKEGNFAATSTGFYQTARLMDLIGDKKSWEQHREAGKFAFLAKDYKAWFKHSIVAAERVSSIDWSIAVEIYRNLGSDAMELKLFAYSAIAYSRAASHFENLALQQAGIFMALSQDANKQARLALKSVKKSSIVFPKSE